MSVTPDERHAWLFDMHVLKQPSTPRVDELVPGFGQTEPSSSEYYFAPNRRIYAHMRYELATAPLNLDWRIDASWQRIDDDRITRNFQSATRRIERNRSDLSGFMVSASRNAPSGSWIAGAEYYHDRVSSQREEQDIATGLTQVVAARFPDGSSVDQGALFLNAERQLSSKHSFSGGIRVSSVDVNLSQTPVSSAAKINTSDNSGDLGWRFNASESWQIVANIGVGYRAPNVFDLGALGNRPGNRFNIPNTSLDSERVTQADFGVRYRSDGLQWEFMVYGLRYDDRITSVLTGGVTPDGRDIVQSVNAADSGVRGAEIGLDAALGEFLRVSAVLNITWGEQTVALQTEPGDRIPPLSGRLGLAYANGGPISVEAWARFANSQDRLSARDVSDVRIDLPGSQTPPGRSNSVSTICSTNATAATVRASTRRDAICRPASGASGKCLTEYPDPASRGRPLCPSRPEAPHIPCRRVQSNSPQPHRTVPSRFDTIRVEKALGRMHST
jgi:outer membrane receptor protein involved in Fe transport